MINSLEFKNNYITEYNYDKMISHKKKTTSTKRQVNDKFFWVIIITIVLININTTKASTVYVGVYIHVCV